MNDRTRKAISGAAAGFLLLVPLSVAGTAMLFALCDEQGCNANPVDKAISQAKKAVGLEDDPVVEAQKEQQRNTQMAGYAQQYLYAVDVEHNGQTYSLIEALQKYFYCEAGPGEPGRYRCEGVSPDGGLNGDITEAINGFQTRPADPLSTYSFAADGPTGSIEVSKGSPSGSRFVFVVPMAGGDHIKITVAFQKGSLVAGVFE